MGRTFNPAQHPRDRFGRFTKSRTVKATAKDRKAAREVAESFRPHRVPDTDRATYLRGIADRPADVTGLVDVNRALRSGKPSDAADRLDQSMTALPDDLLLSRRVPVTAFGSTDLESLAGMKVRDAGFAPAQLGTQPAGDGQVRMHLAVPAGTRAAVDPDSGEVVLDRDTEMVVAKVALNPAGGHDMWLTVLPKVNAGRDVAPVEGDAAIRAELMKLRVPELQARMRERGLKPSRMRKTQLVDALVADETGTDTQTPGPAPDGGSTELAGPPFDERATNAAAGMDALTAAPFSLPRTDTHARLGHRDGLPLASREALIAYREHEYARINGQLRDAGDGLDPVNDPEADQWIRDIDQAMAGSRLTTDVVTWRGIRKSERIFAGRVGGDLTGFTWREHAYVSSSANETVAADFAGRGGVKMRVLTPAGVGAIQVSGMPDDDDGEGELLIEHGVGMRVVADRGVDPGGVRLLDVEVLPVETSAAGDVS